MKRTTTAMAIAAAIGQSRFWKVSVHSSRPIMRKSEPPSSSGTTNSPQRMLGSPTYGR